MKRRRSTFPAGAGQRLLRPLLHSLVSAVTLAGCAHGPRTVGTPGLAAGPGKGWYDAVAWTAAGEEAAQVLSGYLQVDTRNPPGNETAGARYLAGLLQREGIASEILEHAAGRGSLLARLPGSGALPPLCLLSHIDVAAADPTRWPPGKGPLSGARDEQGMIWGRGALDMKGMGAIELLTLLWLKRLGVPLQREVILLAGADEEVDNRGMRFILDQHWGRVGCSHLVNEGGLGIRGLLFEGQTLFAISVAEKGVLWLEMTVTGEGGHGSTPRPEHTTAVLLQLLQRLRARVPATRLDPALQELFVRAGRHRGGLSGFVLQRPEAFWPLLEPKLLRNPATRAALIDTVNITGLSTGENMPNVVPAAATARLDCRLQPGTSPEQVMAELMDLLDNDPRVSFRVLHHVPAAGNTWEDPFFEALARHATDGRPDAVAGPVLSIGFTDSIFARQKGVRAYGLTPFVVDKEGLKSMHAPQERISVENLRGGLRTLFRAVVDVSAAPGSGPAAGSLPATPPPLPPFPPTTSQPAAPAR